MTHYVELPCDDPPGMRTRWAHFADHGCNMAKFECTDTRDKILRFIAFHRVPALSYADTAKTQLKLCYRTCPGNAPVIDSRDSQNAKHVLLIAYVAARYDLTHPSEAISHESVFDLFLKTRLAPPKKSSTTTAWMPKIQAAYDELRKKFKVYSPPRTLVPAPAPAQARRPTLPVPMLAPTPLEAKTLEKSLAEIKEAQKKNLEQALQDISDSDATKATWIPCIFPNAIQDLGDGAQCDYCIDEYDTMEYVLDEEFSANLLRILETCAGVLGSGVTTAKRVFTEANRQQYEDFVRLFGRILYIWVHAKSGFLLTAEKYETLQQDKKRLYGNCHTFLNILHLKLDEELNKEHQQRQEGELKKILSELDKEKYEDEGLQKFLPLQRRVGVPNMCVMTGWSGVSFLLFKSGSEFILARNLLAVFEKIRTRLVDENKNGIKFLGASNWVQFIQCVDDLFGVLNYIFSGRDENEIVENFGHAMAYEFLLYAKGIQKQRDKQESSNPLYELNEIIVDLHARLDGLDDNKQRNRATGNMKNRVEQEQMLSREIVKELKRGVGPPGASSKQKYCYIDVLGDGRCWLYAVFFGLYYHNLLNLDDQRNDIDHFRQKILDKIPDDHFEKTKHMKDKYAEGGDYEFGLVIKLYPCCIHIIEHYRCNPSTRDAGYSERYSPMRSSETGSGPTIRLINVGFHYYIIFPEKEKETVAKKIADFRSAFPTLYKIGAVRDVQ